MRIAYVNTYFQSKHSGGGLVHMGQFVSNATSLGHEIWSYSKGAFPESSTIPTDRLNHIKAMRRMDVFYVRLEHTPPKFCSWALSPRRKLYDLPIVVWEFNTIPDEGLMRGESENVIQKSIEYLKHFGRGCDLAVCMTEPLAEYVQEKIEIKRVLLVPNGSDPALFRPEAIPVLRMQEFKDNFNVVWIGSAKIVYHDFELMRHSANMLWDNGYGNRIKFHIIGPELVQKMADMPPNVYYWGAEKYERIPNWLSAMDVGLYLTKGDLTKISTPLKFFDYLSSGLTVVSTSQPVFVRSIFNQLGQEDLLVPPGDAKYLADVLVKLASDKDRVKKLGLAGRQLVIEKYNWKRAVSDTMEELEKMLKEKGLRPKP